MLDTSISPSADDSDLPRSVLLWGSFDTGKPRIRILCDGIRASGTQLHLIHVDVWGSIADKSQLRGVTAPLAILWRLFASYPRLVWRLLRAPRPDILMVSYPGIVDVLIASCMARWWRVPLCFDVFISLYDTIVQDRALLRPRSLAARLLFRVERFCLRRAQYAFMDTQAHSRRMEALFGMPPHSLGSVWVGAETDRFPPLPGPPRVPGQALRILFYGQFIPLHGLPTIIEAARLLRDAPVEWVLIGQGQETPRIDAMLLAKHLPRVRQLRWVAYEQLIDQMRVADVCLGIFGTSDKAASVIPNKIFQIVAAGKPFITRDSAAIRELIKEPRADAVLIPAGDPAALAQAVLDMAHLGIRAPCHADLRGKVGAAQVGQQFTAMLDRLPRERK